MDEAKESCGIVAARLKKPLAEYSLGGVVEPIYRMLLVLQNRGQLSAGFTTLNPNGSGLFKFPHTGVGLVNTVFKVTNKEEKLDLLRKYASTVGIGHNRYATVNVGDDYSKILEEAQPFYRAHGKLWKEFALAFNGNLANYSALRKQLEEERSYTFKTNTDTEILQHLFAIMIAEEEDKLERKPNEKKCKPNFLQVLKQVYPEFDGAYNIVFLNGNGDLAVIRDPLGFKPLCYGENDDLFAAASESVALTKIGIKEINFVEPGQVVMFQDNKFSVERYAKAEKTAECMFERVYFSDVSSVFSEGSIYGMRTNLGTALAKIEPLKENFKKDKEFIVVPVPQTSKTSAEAYANELELPYREGAIIKNEYVGRIFIEKDRKKIKDKFRLVKDILHNKKVMLVDDSLVRGDTSRELVEYLKNEGGAKEVHMRLTCPPIIAPCFYGIDFPTIKELAAAKYKSVDDAEFYLAQDIGATTLKYQTIEGLTNSLILTRERLCLACLNREYPTKCGEENYKKQL